MLLRLSYEFNIIGDRCLGEEIKPAARFDHGKAKFGQMIIQSITFCLIFVNVYAFLLQGCHQALHQGRSIDKTKDTVAEDGTFHEKGNIVHGRIGGQETDTLSWQGQVFGV